jgi:hypothetical protein
MPYILCFKQCEHIAWQIFKALPNLQQLDAELIDISLGPRGAQQMAVLTTDVFELSFVYGSFLSLSELFVVFSKLFVVSPYDNRINFAAHDRCFTIAMNSGSIAYKPAMIGSGSSR